MTRYKLLLRLFTVLSLSTHMTQCFPDPGKFTLTVNSSQEFNGVAKNLYNGTRIFLKVICEPPKNSLINNKPYVKIGWVLRETQCWNEYAFLDAQIDVLPTYYSKPELRLDLPGYTNHTNFVRMQEQAHECDHTITLDRQETPLNKSVSRAKNEAF